MHQALVTWFGHDKAHQSISHLLSSVRAGSDRAKAVGWLLRAPLLNLSQHFAVLHDCLKSLPPVLLSCCEICFLAGAQTSVLSLQNRARSKTGQAMGSGSGLQNDGWFMSSWHVNALSTLVTSPSMCRLGRSVGWPGLFSHLCCHFCTAATTALRSVIWRLAKPGAIRAQPPLVLTT